MAGASFTPHYIVKTSFLSSISHTKWLRMKLSTALHLKPLCPTFICNLQSSSGGGGGGEGVSILFNGPDSC